ncbi:MAG TPA: hypothetical protein VL068_04315, partial [Microthrixaceae bacterium]|nr:hypothetical protein [Microthrixaceae bacterium]
MNRVYVGAEHLVTGHASATDVTPVGIREFHHLDFPIERILANKGTTTVSVCLPARNEAATIGAIVDTLNSELLKVG